MVVRGYRFLKNLPANLRSLRSSFQELEVKSQATSEGLASIKADLEKALEIFNRGIQDIRQRQADMAHTLSAIDRPRESIKAVQTRASSDLQAANHALDGYYVAFENKFRGSEEVIYQRLKESYTDLLVKELPKDLKKLPVIDIGCGRGEMLRLLRDLNLVGLGIDLNGSMVEQCKKNGYDAKQEEALAYLRKQPSSSLAAIVGIHIVEHVPFEQLFELLQECFRTVAPGGFVFFESPNPENVVVGSLTFWYDSSHLKPIPPDALAFILQYVGFYRTKILRLHQDQEMPKEIPDEMMQKIASKVFGPRDYAAVGFKSGN